MKKLQIKVNCKFNRLELELDIDRGKHIIAIWGGSIYLIFDMFVV